MGPQTTCRDVKEEGEGPRAAGVRGPRLPATSGACANRRAPSPSVSALQRGDACGTRASSWVWPAAARALDSCARTARACRRALCTRAERRRRSGVARSSLHRRRSLKTTPSHTQLPLRRRPRRRRHLGLGDGGVQAFPNRGRHLVRRAGPGRPVQPARVRPGEGRRKMEAGVGLSFVLFLSHAPISLLSRASSPRPQPSSPWRSPWS